jgi:proteasome assembly chaperone (PAC2) family protein
MIIHDTPTYQISFIYRKRQIGYDSDTIALKKYQLFDLKVKGQRQNVVMLVHDTLSHDYTPTYQISLTYLTVVKELRSELFCHLPVQVN